MQRNQPTTVKQAINELHKINIELNDIIYQLRKENNNITRELNALKNKNQLNK